MAKRPLGPIGHRWYTPEEFRAFAQGGGTDTAAAVRAYLTCETVEKTADDSRTVRFVISTDAIDRQRDVIAQGGWQVDNYLKNPVVLFSHDYNALPVARATSLAVHGNKLVAEAQFVEKDIYPFAETVYQMVKHGYLRATSVGFAPKKFSYNSERSGVDYAEQELLEFSIVPVPANPEALMAASADGIDLAPLKEWVTDVLKGGGERMGLSKAILADIVTTLEKAVPPKAKMHPDCPLGQECPYEEGMAECPKGENCAMKKVAAEAKVDGKELARIVAEALKPLQASLDELKARRVTEQLADVLDPTGVVLELDEEELELPDYETAALPDDVGLDAEAVRAAFQASLKESLTELVGAELNRLRGRLD